MAMVNTVQTSRSSSGSTTSTSMSSSASNNPTASKTYVLGPRLGAGSFGQVFECQEAESGQQYACKVVSKASLGRKFHWTSLEREVRVMCRLRGQHPGLLSIQGLQQDSLAVHLILELCRGGDLLSLLHHGGRLPEPAARLVLRQLAPALATCHSLGVVHRDIKPENVLFDRPAQSLHSMTSQYTPDPPVQAKLADFGLSVILGPGETTDEKVGSLQYCAPEVHAGQAYGAGADVWSLGVLLYVMLSGTFPFPERPSSPKEAYGALSWKVRFWHKERWATVSEEAKDLVRWMLQEDPQSRPAAAALLSHPWAACQKQAVPRALSCRQSIPSAISQSSCYAC